MAGIGSYSSACFGKAFSFSWGVLDTLGTALGSVLFPIAANYYPALGPRMNDLAWQIPLGAASGLFIARFVAAPYLLHKELEGKLGDSEQHLRDIKEIGPEVALSVSEDAQIVIHNIGGGTAEIVDLTSQSGSNQQLLFQGLPVSYMEEGKKFRAITGVLRTVTGKYKEAKCFPPDLVHYCRELKKDMKDDDCDLPLLKQTITTSYFNKNGVRFDRDFELVFNVITEALNIFPRGAARITRPQGPHAAP